MVAGNTKKCISMNLMITAFSDPKKLAELKVDAFIEKYSENPFYLSAFLERQMQNSADGSSPLMLIFRINETIVGVVPLLVTEKLGIRSAQFIYNFYFSPDFVFNNKYSNLCMNVCLDFIFKNLRCQFVTFDLPADSPNLNILQQTCYEKSILVIKKNDDFSHAIIALRSSWDDFVKQKSKDFRKNLHKMERRIITDGKGHVSVFENQENEEDVFRMIMGIEQQCWKQGWRQNNEVKVDHDLLNIWAGSSSEIRTNPDFKRFVWILSLNDTIIAYNLAILYKGTAYFCKTSFDNKYRHLYPGIYLNNVAIRDLFSSDSVHLIDFMTNLPFHSRWTKTRLTRVRFSLSKGLVPKLFNLIIKQLHATKITQRVKLLNLLLG